MIYLGTYKWVHLGITWGSRGYHVGITWVSKVSPTTHWGWSSRLPTHSKSTYDSLNLSFNLQLGIKLPAIWQMRRSLKSITDHCSWYHSCQRWYFLQFPRKAPEYHRSIKEVSPQYHLSITNVAIKTGHWWYPRVLSTKPELEALNLEENCQSFDNRKIARRKSIDVNTNSLLQGTEKGAPADFWGRTIIDCIKVQNWYSEQCRPRCHQLAGTQHHPDLAWLLLGPATQPLYGIWRNPHSPGSHYVKFLSTKGKEKTNWMILGNSSNMSGVHVAGEWAAVIRGFVLVDLLSRSFPWLVHPFATIA